MLKGELRHLGNLEQTLAKPNNQGYSTLQVGHM